MSKTIINTFDKCSMSVYPPASNSIIAQHEKLKLHALLDELAALEEKCPGKFHWRHRGNSVSFWIHCKGKQKYITRDKSQVYLYARKEYLRLLLDDLRVSNYSEWVKTANDLFQSFSLAGLDLQQIILTSAQYKWALDPQSQNPYRREELKFETNNGVLVRTKSEQFIGNLLEEFNIPYRYEPELRIGNRSLYPDFVIMTADGRKVILEHFGRMDLRDYIDTNIDRLMAYNSRNLLIGRDIMISFEHDVRSREKYLPIIYQLMTM